MPIFKIQIYWILNSFIKMQTKIYEVNFKFNKLGFGWVFVIRITLIPNFSDLVFYRIGFYFFKNSLIIYNQLYDIQMSIHC